MTIGDCARHRKLKEELFYLRVSKQLSLDELQLKFRYKMGNSHIPVSKSTKIRFANSVKKLIDAKGITLHEASSAIGLKYLHLTNFLHNGELSSTSLLLLRSWIQKQQKKDK